jgi:outer membrane protein OmpA-like peptidoglycan-associated protein
VAAATPLAAAAPAAARPTPGGDDDSDNRGFIRFGTLALAVVGGGLLVAAVLGSLIGSGMNDPAPAPAVALNPSAPPVGGPDVLGTALTGAGGVPAAPAVPEGAGVLASEVEGRPKLSVYFDTASAVVTPDFATVAAPLKAWIDANPGDRLVVSGYNDPRGDAAFNAELSKNRAQSVQAALEAMGVPAGAIDLEKPAETTDATTTLANARRVDIVVRPAG